MFDLGWMELLVIGVVALIVVGPKDLPGMFRTVGQFMGKARAMAREFQRTMEAAADEAGVKEATSGLKEATKGLQTISNPMSAAKSSVKDLASSVAGDEVDDAAAAEAAAKAARGKAALEKAQAEAATKAAEAAAAKEP